MDCVFTFDFISTHMKRIIPVIFFGLYTMSVAAQNDSIQAVADILAFQHELNASYKNREESPLDPKDFRKFKSHPFFPIDLSYRVIAKLTATPGSPVTHLKTSTTRLTNDRVYGFLEFVIKEETFKLPVYQSSDIPKDPEYADYLFFLFTDLTNGKQSYGGGRYIDLRIPKDGSEQLILDFNKAYNPYCAYSHRYSCPKVPEENQMDIEIPVGVMYKQK